MAVKCYIAGRITGRPSLEAYAEFMRAGHDVRAFGGIVLGDEPIVLNPCELPKGMTPADYMRICLSMVDSADAVLLLPGYEESRGASIERAYAEYIGKRIYYLIYNTEEERYEISDAR